MSEPAKLLFQFPQQPAAIDPFPNDLSRISQLTIIKKSRLEDGGRGMNFLPHFVG